MSATPSQNTSTTPTSFPSGAPTRSPSTSAPTVEPTLFPTASPSRIGVQEVCQKQGGLDFTPEKSIYRSQHPNAPDFVVQTSELFTNRKGIKIDANAEWTFRFMYMNMALGGEVTIEGLPFLCSTKKLLVPL